MRPPHIIVVCIAVALSGCASTRSLYLRGESSGELYGPLTSGYRLCTFNLGHEWYVAHEPTAEELAFFRRLTETALDGIDFTDAPPEQVVEFLRQGSMEHAPYEIGKPAPIPIVLDFSRIKGGDRQADGKMLFKEKGQLLYANVPETVTVHIRSTDLWWAIKALAHEANMNASIRNDQVILEPILYVQPAPSGDVLKAAPED